jgi:hypothetical protein
MQQAGKILIFAGLVLIVIGVVLYLLPGKFGWFGNLPGDIRIKRENFQFYFPLTTMILISVFLSLLLWIIRKLGR